MVRRDVFLKIEALDRYSPLAPVPCARHYGRDCMFNEGHELGRLSPAEIAASTVNAVVYHEYLDPHYSVPNTAKIVEADVNEPPWDRRVPGAVLWAQPGERLYIHVLNGDPDNCHSFHVHGVKYGIDSDGSWPFGIRSKDGRRSDEIRPGETWTYVFDATEETVGAWAFHTHAHKVGSFVNRGLFGGLIVRPRTSVCPDHEVPMFVHQMVGTGIPCDYISGTLTPGDTFSFVFGTDLGVCRYHCQIHGPMMWGEVDVVQGGPRTVTVSAINNKWTPQMVQIGPGGTVTWKNAEVESNHDHIVVADGGGASTYCLNGRAFVGNTPTIVADSGQRLRWYLFNLDLSGVWHNFHPHSARWQLPAPSGGAGDVHGLSPVESFVTDTEVPRALRLPCELEELQCDPPADACRVRLKGDFLFHCHIEEHMMAGLAGLVRAREYVWLTDKLAGELTVNLPLDDGSNQCPVVDLDRCAPRHQPMTDDMKATSMGQVKARSKRGARAAAPSTGMAMGGAVMAHAAPMGPMAGMSGMGPMTVMSGMGGMTAAPVDMSHAATAGIWELLPCDSQVLAVHAALLHTGKILFFAGSGNDELYTTGLRSVVWDYENGAFHQPFTPVDFFCAGQAFLPDGRLFVAGGTKDYGFTGLPDAFLFDPILEQWIRVQDMAEGRWYPTLLTISDGRVLTVSGGPDHDELYSSLTGWTRFGPGQGFPLYPHMFLLKDGRVFYTGGHLGGSGGVRPGRFNPLTAASLAPVPIPGTFDLDHRDQCASVLLPPAQAQKVLILGGGDPAINKAHLIDLSVASPAYHAAPSLHHARMHANAVILPDRTVHVSGGSLHAEDPASAVLQSEIYHPATNSWSNAATATVPRMYHSVALLLPDGRVITAGSNPHRRDDELRLELFHPPYLFKGERPFIEFAPPATNYGATFTIRTPQAKEIKWAQLISPMATTHSVDTTQRLVDLRITRRTFCELEVAVPREPNIAPPGWYMLFITNQQGIPSVAHWVNLAAPLPTSVKVLKRLPASVKRMTVKSEGLKIRRVPEV
jgi:FtsP/CotA-like multicopper oxidase with cupredoxin domain